MITQENIRASLLNVGIKSGDQLLVHSSLKKIGLIDGGGDILINTLLDIVGEDGILAMPSFNYTTRIPEPFFDPQHTPGNTGVLTEIFRKRERCLRSLSPTHSVLAMGRDAQLIINGHLDHESLGIGSPLDKIAQMSGLVLLIGVTHTSNSTIHIGEAYAKVKKFFYKAGELPVARILQPNGKLIETQIDCSGSCGRAFNAVEMVLRSKGLVKDFDIGDAPAFLMKGIDIIKTVVEMISRQRDILFCTRSTCRRCVLGREYALYGKTITDM